ncbi:MAG: Fic family protein [Tenuifilaceae bacterium]
MIKQPEFDRNTPYNQLPLLPISPDIIDKDIITKWGLASRSLAELKRNIQRLPNPSMLVNTISLQEAKSSTEIENIFTTSEELYKAISDSVKEENANPATKEVLNYREALWTGFNDFIEKGIIDHKTIVNIYQRAKKTNEGIRPPQSQVVIRRGNSEFKPGEIIYTPPRGKGVVEEKLNNLIHYLNDDKCSNVDPLIKMVIAHYQFEAIHPFGDGNGRTGRILNLLYLVKSELISQPILYLSKYIIDRKEDYYFHLAGVTQRRAWKPWILFMLEAVEQTSGNTNHLIDAIVSQMESTLNYGKKELKWYSKEINEVIFSQPYIKPATIGRIIGRSSRTTLTKYMLDLTEKKILTPKQEGKEVYYINNDLVRILEG